MNTADVEAFQRIATALGQSEWIDCNEPGRSPCDLCTDRTLRRITCEDVPVFEVNPSTGRRLQTSTYEHRITGIVLKNVGILGTIPLDAFASLTSLKVVDLSSDPTLPYGNVAILPPGDNCVNLEACGTIPCDFGPASPACYSTDFEGSKYVARPKSLSTETIVAIVVPVCIVLLFIAFWIWLCYPSWKHPKKKHLATSKQSNQQQQGNVVLHERARGAGKPHNQDESRYDEEEDPTPKLSRNKSFKRAQSNSNLRNLLQKASALGVNVKQPAELTRSKHGAPRGDWVQSVDANGNLFWTDRQTGQFSWRNPNEGRSGGGGAMPSPQYGSNASMYGYPTPGAAATPSRGAHGGFGSQQAPPSPYGQQQMQAYQYAPPPMPSPQQQQQMAAALPPGYNPWQEVYDPANDRSYWINIMTRQISYTQPM